MNSGQEDSSSQLVECETTDEFPEVRYCSHCNKRMTHVIRGMSQPGDELLEHEYLEFVGGCIVGPEDEDWYCKNCGAKEFDFPELHQDTN